MNVIKYLGKTRDGTKHFLNSIGFYFMNGINNNNVHDISDNYFTLIIFIIIIVCSSCFPYDIHPMALFC